MRGLDLGIPDTPLEVKGVLISKFDLVASATAGGLVAILAVFFQVTRVGRALRAVADDHQAALSVGIPLERIWALVWAAAGAVALVTGLLWGSRLGVQFALTQVALKALPVIILGGFTSIAGAIVGGLDRGCRRRRSPRCTWGRSSAAESRTGSPTCWRCSSSWCGRTACSARSGSSGCDVIYREAGQFRVSYAADQRIFPIVQDRVSMALLLAVAFVGVPLLASDYALTALLIPMLVLALAALGLNILTGYAGQFSLGTAAFMSVGAFAAYNLQLRLPWLPAAGDLRARRADRRRGGDGVRPALPADQGLLPGGGDAGGAVLRRLAVHEGGLVQQLLQLGSRSPPSEWSSPGCRSRRRSRRYLLVLSIVALLALVAKNLSRTRHRPLVDGGPGHGRGGGR